MYFKISSRIKRHSTKIQGTNEVLPSPALTELLPVNRFSSKLAPKVPDNNPRTPRFCSFASLLIVSPAPFINNLDYSSDLTIL